MPRTYDGMATPGVWSSARRQWRAGPLNPSNMVLSNISLSEIRLFSANEYPQEMFQEASGEGRNTFLK
jgi:hypothetical protein